MHTTLFQQLPNIYTHFLPDIFDQPIHQEVYADCRDCNMCKETPTVSDHVFFSKETKCCTFKPIVPNYLVGSILTDESQTPKMREFVNKNHNIYPLGVFPTNDDLHYYEKSVLPNNFGNDDSFFCDFFSDGDCGIWKHRNAMCSTYFCHYFKGFIGKYFWDEVRDFLQYVEDTVSEYCAHELEIPIDYIKNNTTNFFINVRKAKWKFSKKSTLTDAEIWGKWANSKEQYFIKCAELTASLTHDEFIQLNPTKYKIRHAALVQSYEKMIKNAIPDRLIFNPKCKIIDFDDTQSFFYIARLIKLPNVVKDIIKLFDGKNTSSQVIQLCSNDYNVDIDQEYIRHLYEQEILIST